LVAAEADLFVVAAYGLVFGRKSLTLPRLGCVNLHASLLPRYRGASPIAAAILSGDLETGVSLMEMELGLDTGPVIATASIPIAADETTASLTTRLASLGAQLAFESLPRFARGELKSRPQALAGASLTRPLTKGDGQLDWRLPADDLARRVRAFWPWPRSWTTAQSGLLQVHEVRPAGRAGDEAPGLVLAESALTVSCGHGALEIVVAQPAGRSAMTGREVLAGRLVRPGEQLTSPTSSATSPIVVDVPSTGDCSTGDCVG
jgi:methionyl-tRNA formyltransferase